MLSSGQRTLFGEVASWVFLAAVMVAGVTHLDELTSVAHRLMGTEPPARVADGGAQPSEAAGDRSEVAVSGGGFTAELPVGDDGHFHAEAEINGQTLQVLVDTGASVVALTAEDAEAAGIFVAESDFTQRIQTANGIARVAPVTFDDIRIGDIRVRDVRGVVSEAGALSVSLLGMTFLNRLERVDMRGGKLILEE